MEKDSTRISLRPITDEDEADCIALLRDNIINRTYMLPDYEDDEAARPLFRRLRDLSTDPTHFVRAVSLDGKMIGFVNDVVLEEEVAEMGYVIRPDLHHRGYATEALRQTIRALFDRGLRVIRAGFFEENAASRRVMEKNGMTPTGEEETIDWRGAAHRCVYYAIRRE
ncbi:MAG: GNAT family N-acetyltransferase, partial [Clostridia bacterium]|nr:GNAT family N-acetyltransferase [Clostridia bacterium]